MKKKFWKNKSVLITGHEGFLGSNITKRLISLGADIVGLDIKVGRKETCLTKKDREKIIAVKGNAANYKLVKSLISHYNINIIFHLSAEAIVSNCNKHPLRAFRSNIQGTWSVLEAARNSDGIEALICASSDKAYGSHQELPYKENTPLRGDHPYDASKSCADLLAYTYFHTYDLPVAITRCGNIYGAGDFNFSRIIPDLMRSIIRDKTLFIRSDGKFTRDYVYVEDIVDGYILLAEKLRAKKLSGGSFNLSAESPISVLDLVNSVYKITGKKPNFKILSQARYEIKHQYLCAQKARKILGWKPKYTLEQGILKTLRWYEAALI